MGDLNADGQPHGQGGSFSPDSSPVVTLMVDADPSKSGRWVNGHLHGRAIQHPLDEDQDVVYEGLFRDNLLEGPGVCSYQDDGRRYEGEFEDGVIHGLGAMWNNKGRLIQCGSWDCDELMKSCAVPMRLIPVGKFLSTHGQKTQPTLDRALDLYLSRGFTDSPCCFACPLCALAAKTASLLYPDGSYFIGPIDALNQPYPAGSMFSSIGDLLPADRWTNAAASASAPFSSSSSAASVASASSAVATSAASSSSAAASSSRMTDE